MIVKGLYTILLGIFLTLFVGIGIATFYPEPLYETPAPCLTPAATKAPLSELDVQSANIKCDRAQKIINERRSEYVQIMSSISLVSSVIFLVISMTIVKNVEVFSYGFLFGSMFTLLYSVLRGLSSNQAQFKFILMCVSLAIVMIVGYLRFIKQSSVNTVK